MLKLKLEKNVNERELTSNIINSLMLERELRNWVWSLGKVGVVWAWFEHNSPKS
jgi:hypothetical protein